MTDQEINESVARKLGKGHIQDGWEKVCVIPDFCHSIEAAWEIVEFVCKQPKRWVNILTAADSATCVIREWEDHIAHTTGYWSEHADTAPMAICVAFLKLP